MIRKILCLILCGVAPFASAQTPDTAPVHSAIPAATMTQYLRPAYADLETATQNLRLSVHDFCDQPEAPDLTQTQNAFRQTVLAWGGVEWFRVGPVFVENRIERILFYPDRKGTGQKQVRRAIIEKDQTTQTAQTLSNKSVAVQGLGALEVLVFGNNAQQVLQADPFLCGYAKAITDNLTNIATAISQPWQADTNITRQWLAPFDSNPWFTTEPDIVALISGEIIRGLEVVKDIRIGAFLRKPPKKDRPKSAVLWRSQSTTAMIAANLRGLHALFTNSAVSSVLNQEHSPLLTAVNQRFLTTIKTAQELDAPVDALLSDPEKRAKLVALQTEIGLLIDLLDTEFLAATGLTIGFSFSDGD